jgi:hypothetical protein
MWDIEESKANTFVSPVEMQRGDDREWKIAKWERKIEADIGGEKKSGELFTSGVGRFEEPNCSKFRFGVSGEKEE